jgi:hypothetical protein
VCLTSFRQATTRAMSLLTHCFTSPTRHNILETESLFFLYCSSPTLRCFRYTYIPPKEHQHPLSAAQSWHHPPTSPAPASSNLGRKYGRMKTRDSCPQSRRKSKSVHSLQFRRVWPGPTNKSGHNLGSLPLVLSANSQSCTRETQERVHRRRSHSKA